MRCAEQRSCKCVRREGRLVFAAFASRLRRRGRQLPRSSDGPAVTPGRAAANGRRSGPVGRMQSALATAIHDDPEWKEFLAAELGGRARRTSLHENFAGAFDKTSRNVEMEK